MFGGQFTAFEVSGSVIHVWVPEINAHFHFHIVVLDGLFSEDAHQAAHFHPASDPGARDLQRSRLWVSYPCDRPPDRLRPDHRRWTRPLRHARSADG
jgi:hypothetical protein